MPASRFSNFLRGAISSIALVAIFVGCYSSGAAQRLNQEYTYKHYTVQDGLIQMQVMSVFIDSKGYLWCATKAGLSRFDGYHFKNFSNAILPGFDLTVMGENKDGTLLLFGPTKFAELLGDSLKEHSYPEGNQSSSILVHSHSFKQKVVFHYSPGNMMLFSVMDYSNLDSLKLYPTDASRGGIIYLEEGEKNYIWQKTSDVINISEVKTGKLVRQINNPKSLVSIVKYGEYYVGSNEDHEVFLISNDTFTPLFSINEPVRFLQIIATPDNDALVVKTDQNLYYFKDKLIPVKQNLTQIRDLVFDSEENLWVSTEEGLYNFFQLNFQNFKFNMGNKDWVWSVLEDGEHNFWFASYQNGLWKWDGKEIHDYTKQLNKELPNHLKRRPLPEHYRYYMGASKRGNTLFFPTECNVLKLENNQFTPVEGLPELPFQMTKVDEDGTLYCSGYPGLFKLTADGEIDSWERDDLNVSSIVNFERDKNGDMLVIGQNGASVIRGEQIIHFANESLLHSYSLAKDHTGNIWISGIRNINLYTGDSVRLVEARNEEAIYSMLFVEPHFLFLGGIKGLYIADLEKYYRDEIFETVLFNQSNGFTGIECGQNGFMTDAEGMVWIPTSDLVTRFDPNKLISKKIKPPRIYLNAFFSADNIQWHPANQEDIKTLPYNQNNLRFSMDVVSFANSGNIRYYFRLKGLQNTWSDPSEINEINYYNLIPGDYVFEVKADAGVSQATSETIIFAFTILQPFWKMWWFVFLEIGILSLLVYMLVQYFRKREKQKAAIQQRLTQLRSEALSAQLDPHFVMNCLNNISGLVNAGYKKQANDYIVSFSKLLRVILQNVKKETIRLSDEIEIVSKYMELEQFRCNHCFSFQIVLPKNYSTEKILVPPMMLQPLVENSIKHGFGTEKMDNAKIEIKLEVEDKFLTISIVDNGKGLKNQSESLGTGLGTKITRERIELLQKRGNIQFEIRDANPGAEVRFRIPLVLDPDHE